MTKFKVGDHVTIGDSSEVYKLQEVDFDSDLVAVDVRDRSQIIRRLFDKTGVHIVESLQDLKHHSSSEPPPSTPKDLAYLQLSGGLSYGEYSGNKVVEDHTDHKQTTGGLRHDTGKLRLDLLPAEWELELARITTEGSKKYAPRNWEKGMAWSKMLGCFRRHVLKFLLGEKYDKETGCHHLGLAAWNLLALMSYDMRGLGENDLPPSVKIGPNFERKDNT